jgi:hypothetical protein
MNGRTTIDVGIAGSITMVLLCAAVAVLCVSFYRRYKRANERSDNPDSNEDK